MVSPKTRMVRGLEATLFRDGTPPIYLLSDGRFAAEYAGKWEAKGTLKAIEKAIRTGRPTLRIFNATPGHLYHHADVKVVEATEFLDSKIVDKDGKRVYKGSGEWFVLDDEHRVEKLVDLEKRQAEAQRRFYEEYAEIMEGARRVYVREFKELLKGETQEAAE